MKMGSNVTEFHINSNNLHHLLMQTIFDLLISFCFRIDGVERIIHKNKKIPRSVTNYSIFIVYLSQIQCDDHSNMNKFLLIYNVLLYFNSSVIAKN